MGTDTPSLAHNSCYTGFLNIQSNTYQGLNTNLQISSLLLGWYYASSLTYQPRVPLIRPYSPHRMLQLLLELRHRYSLRRDTFPRTNRCCFETAVWYAKERITWWGKASRCWLGNGDTMFRPWTEEHWYAIIHLFSSPSLQIHSVPREHWANKLVVVTPS